MMAIRSTGNKSTEIKLISAFKAHAIKGWRRRQKVIGRPDFVFRNARLAIFVDGCFWHGCRLHCRMPKSRREYWLPKIKRNKFRDNQVSRMLSRQGWKVLRVWEHSIKENPVKVVMNIKAILASSANTASIRRMNDLDAPVFESLLHDLCRRLTEEINAGRKFNQSAEFERRVREVTSELLKVHKVTVDFDPHPFGFPDIVLGQFGVEVKFTTNDTWRSVANSVFERFRDKKVKWIYVVFGKMGGVPGVRWKRYDDCVMHVRTSHVPRFEVDIDAEESLFKKFGISYAEFSHLTEEKKMEHVRDYARKRLKKGDHLWWLDNAEGDSGHSLPLQIQLYSNLAKAEQLKMRAEASLLCPQILKHSRKDRYKYTEAIMYLLTYRSVLCSRDTFSAGSAAGPERGGHHIERALKKIQDQMLAAAEYLDDALFVEYWGRSVPTNQRIAEWLKQADIFAKEYNPPWKPSGVLTRLATSLKTR